MVLKCIVDRSEVISKEFFKKYHPNKLLPTKWSNQIDPLLQFLIDCLGISRRNQNSIVRLKSCLQIHKKKITLSRFEDQSLSGSQKPLSSISSVHTDLIIRYRLCKTGSKSRLEHGTFSILSTDIFFYVGSQIAFVVVCYINVINTLRFKYISHPIVSRRCYDQSP